ncbi:hypothetical protein Moror_12260 [Moniliophthora roreri MCA 2997]|uniref:Uncharacterized protein n=1 Tax=Moniliophthora roreri (strain MCA 2997) TaxID=1381753 RepID=V2W7N8_MONRO|nr:hypothetical protein Moror_12260 [Moniliophthora roreri MCA 2997]
MSNLRSNQPITIPPLNPALCPLLTPKVFRRLKPQFHCRVEHIPVVGGEVVAEVPEDVGGDKEWENQIPSNTDNPLTFNLRSPTPVLIQMMQLIDHISALCADWSAISPEIARSTCVADASKFSLDIHLATVPTNKGLTVLHTEGLIRAQTLCQMIGVMMTNPMRILEENVEESTDREINFLFVGADPWKVRLLSIEEQVAQGWQLMGGVPLTLLIRTVEEMLDTSEDYNTELHGDGES